MVCLKTFLLTPRAVLISSGELLSFNGEEADDAFEMEDFMAKVKPGAKVKLEIFRKGRLIDITLTAGALKKTK